MENIDLSNLTYEELCTLEEKIKRRKDDFINFIDLVVIKDEEGNYHLCSKIGKINSGYDCHDFFTGQYISHCDPLYAHNHSFIFCAVHYNMDSSLHCLKKDINGLWEQIITKLSTENNEDIEQAMLDEQAKILQLVTSKK